MLLLTRRNNFFKNPVHKYHVESRSSMWFNVNAISLTPAFLDCTVFAHSFLLHSRASPLDFKTTAFFLSFGFEMTKHFRCLLQELDVIMFTLFVMYNCISYYDLYGLAIADAIL